MAKRKTKKKPVFAPFSRTTGLELFDADFTCNSDEKSIESMDIYDLKEMQDRLVEAIFDCDELINIELSSYVLRPDNGSVADTRRRRQQYTVELRKIKNKIKMMEHNNITKEISLVA